MKILCCSLSKSIYPGGSSRIRLSFCEKLLNACCRGGSSHQKSFMAAFEDKLSTIDRTDAKTQNVTESYKMLYEMFTNSKFKDLKVEDKAELFILGVVSIQERMLDINCKQHFGELFASAMQNISIQDKQKISKDDYDTLKQRVESDPRIKALVPEGDDYAHTDNFKGMLL